LTPSWPDLPILPLLEDSPLFAAAVILNPNYGLLWLEENWKDHPEWVVDAKTGLKDYFNRWYPDPDPFDLSAGEQQPQERRQRRAEEQDAFDAFLNDRHPSATVVGEELERFYRLNRPTTTINPIRWWADHREAFPRLAALALDLLAVPAMASDCERSFSLGKLSVSSQRHSLTEETIELIQLMKNWVMNQTIMLGGPYVNREPVWPSM
jgi:hypothetical protein